MRPLLLNLLVRSRIVSFWWPAVAKRLDSIGVKRCRCYIMYICGIHGKQVTLMFILMCWSILKLEANGSETWLKSLRDFDFFSDCVYKHWMLPRPWSQKIMSHKDETVTSVGFSKKAQNGREMQQSMSTSTSSTISFHHLHYTVPVKTPGKKCGTVPKEILHDMK